MTIGDILIIDDESVNAEAIKDTLEDVNYNVVLAADAKQAKAVVKDQVFDLIIMDVWMHGQDGMSLLEEWMNAGFPTPIVMMSGHAQHQDVVRAIKLGAVDFLEKPLHDILPLVRKLLSKNNNDMQKIRGINFDLSIKEIKHIVEKQYFNHHLQQNNYNISKVAEAIKLERTTLYRKMKDLGIEKK